MAFCSIHNKIKTASSGLQGRASYAPMSKHTLCRLLYLFHCVSATLALTRTSSLLFYHFCIFSGLPRTLFLLFILIVGCHVKSVGQSPVPLVDQLFVFLSCYHNCLTHFSVHLGCSFALAGVSSVRAAPWLCLESIFLAQCLIRGSIRG